LTSSQSLVRKKYGLV